MLSNILTLLVLGGAAQAKVQFLGVAIAGGDFGCLIDGTCPTESVQLPLSSLGGGDGQGQMNHWVQDVGLNMFRLPTSWQFLTNNNAAASALDSGNLDKYDQLVQACLTTRAYCMIDIHNFARFNGDGAIIGQGGPSNDQFASLWAQLATKYASNSKVVFELMNEPHDLDVPAWATTCQVAVTAIRNAGATSQMILLPGTNFDSAATLVSSGSADALMGVTNPDGTTDNLLLDIHKYLDVDNSGTHAECTTDNVGNFTIVADYLRAKGRQGLVSETGASSQPSCMTAFCAQNTFINANPDVFVGLVAWGAGSFDAGYVLSLTPTRQGNRLTDNALMSQCVVKPWVDSEGVVAPAGPPPSQSGTGSNGPPATGTGANGPPATGTWGTGAGSVPGPPGMSVTMTLTGVTVGVTVITAGLDTGTVPPPTPVPGDETQFGGAFGGQPGTTYTGPTGTQFGGQFGGQTGAITPGVTAALNGGVPVKAVAGLLLGGLLLPLFL